jgi:hypothetical protein
MLGQIENAEWFTRVQSLFRRHQNQANSLELRLMLRSVTSDSRAYETTVVSKVCHGRVR